MGKVTRNLLLTVFLLVGCSQMLYAQLSNFTLTVTPTNETCTANGGLTFNVSGTTAGSTILYSIYRLPNVTTPIAVLGGNTFNGLVSGIYRVVATQSLGNDSGTQQQGVTILNQITLLTYQLQKVDAMCGADGRITVNTITGTAVSYEIFAGPVIRPLQVSNVFSGLPIGQYSVRVFDACGEGVVQTITIIATPRGIKFREQGNNVSQCNNINNITYLENLPGTIIHYPVTVVYTVFPPSGPSLTFTQNLSSGSPYSQPVSQVFPMYYNVNSSYQISATDGCGQVFTSELFLIRPRIDVFASVIRVSCTEVYFEIYLNQFGTAPFTINFLSAPAGFDPVVYNPQHPNLNGPTYATYYNPLVPLPSGSYNVQIVDACGRTATRTFTVSSQAVAGQVAYGQAPGCELGYGSLDLQLGMPYYLDHATVVSAPAGYPFALPQNVDSFIFQDNHHLVLEHLPGGNYIIQTTNICGVSQLTTINIKGYEVLSSIIEMIPNCNAFNLELRHLTNLGNFPPHFYLDQFNSVTNTWIQVMELQNDAVNYNITQTGIFRVRLTFRSFRNPRGPNGEDVYDCEEVLYNFEYSGQPKINDVYAFSCNNGTYDAIVDAVGIAPLLYRITEKDGVPFTIENGNSSVFLGLAAGSYNFQVEDACGNILNSDFDVPSPFVFAITPTTFCVGQPGSLTVPDFALLQYSWWKDNDQSNILSTGNALDFASLTQQDSGTYHVRVQYTGNPDSCIDFILDYTIDTAANAPSAGQDGAVSYCGGQGVVDLFTLLQGTFDTGGTWQEVTNSGALTANLWDSAAVAAGAYRFKYRVDGSCNSFDESFVDVVINVQPATPIASVNPVACENAAIELFATTVSGTYSWTGPNGFLSAVQNPVIASATAANDGTYSVTVSENGCVSSASSVQVAVGTVPVFSITGGCVNSNYTLTAAPNNGQWQYRWDGPNNFRGDGNPLVLSNGGSGNYTLTVTDTSGCSDSRSINVPNTICSIANVITPNNDQTNDAFDLSGLDVLRLEIYNRWGKRVYEKDNYRDEWHGQNTHDGDLPDGTYFYLLSLKSGSEQQGWVFLSKG